LPVKYQYKKKIQRKKELRQKDATASRPLKPRQGAVVQKYRLGGKEERLLRERKRF
jgi:hypothetical protein